MIRALVRLLDDRLGSAAFTRAALRKAFPDHWSFMLGELCAYLFVFLVASGTYLGFFFRDTTTPVRYDGAYELLRGTTVSEAYRSVLDLSFGGGFGLAIRQAHHWAALLFLAAVGAHLARVFFTGAFRRPRELTWYLGALLLGIGVYEGFTGYSLPYDALGGAGLRIADAVFSSVPLLGGWIADMLFGKPFPSEYAVSRIFFQHVFLMPALLATLIGAHVALVWRLHHTQFRGPGRTEDNVVGLPLWPNYTIKSIALLFATVAAALGLGAFVQINPVWEYGPYVGWKLAEPAQPDWYVGWLDGALRLGPGWSLVVGGHPVPAPFWPAAFMPLIGFAILLFWPNLERALTRDGRRHHLLDDPADVPLRTGFGVGALFFISILGLAGSDDVQAQKLGIDVATLVDLYRALLLLAPVLGGALAWRIAREVAARRRARAELDAERRVLLVRDAAGGFDEEPPQAVRT